MESTSTEPRFLRSLKAHYSIITSLVHHPSEKKLASGSLDNTVILWDLSGKHHGRSNRYQGHDEPVMDVTFSPTGKYLASASCDKTVRLWVPDTSGMTWMFRAHSKTVRSVQFTADGTKIITASDDKVIKFWSSEKFKLLSTLVGHTNWVRRAMISPDGSVVASCSDDRTIKLWNPDTGECIHTYQDNNNGPGRYLAWHPSNCYVAVGTSRGVVKLYDIRTDALVQYYRIHKDTVNQVDFHPSGIYMISASKDGTMKVMDILMGQPLYTLTGHNGPVNAVKFSPKGAEIASCGDDKTIFIWKTKFTKLADESREYVENSNSDASSNTRESKITLASKVKSQGAKIWYQCYHSNKYPATTFIHLDDAHQNLESIDNDMQEPNAHSTFVESMPNQVEFFNSNSHHTDIHDISIASQNRECQTDEYSSHNVGHNSHIPRKPPTPTTYTIPSIMNKSVGTYNDNSIFGMIKLGDNDVCYTSGTIEWVGRKRSFPINSGFKIINEYNTFNTEPLLKKVKKNNRTFTYRTDEFKECDCGDVLPTVHAIVDHLNALHEAVDLVDLRLNTLESTIGNNNI